MHISAPSCFLLVRKHIYVPFVQSGRSTGLTNLRFLELNFVKESNKFGRIWLMELLVYNTRVLLYTIKASILIHLLFSVKKFKTSFFVEFLFIVQIYFS
jgi:hypothetical protein